MKTKAQTHQILDFLKKSLSLLLICQLSFFQIASAENTLRPGEIAPAPEIRSDEIKTNQNSELPTDPTMNLFDDNPLSASSSEEENEYDAEGFNKEGFDSEGFNREGYNASGYDRNGYNSYGYNAEGFDSAGFDTHGYDREGYNTHSYNSAGYNRDGFNMEGFNDAGYDRSGFDRQGYNQYGYDARGFNYAGYNDRGFDINGFNQNGMGSDGFDWNGFDAEGYNRAGFNSSGFDRAGFDASGFDTFGYDPNGFDRNGFNAYGYDAYGFDASGFNKSGIDRDGYNWYGNDVEGYNRLGFDALGFDRGGFGFDGYNRAGYFRDGYDIYGYDSQGFSREGYDLYGYDRQGYGRDGHNREGFNRAGFHYYGFDAEGYDANGFNSAGYNRAGLNIYGYDSEGYDTAGFNSSGFNREGYDAAGYDQNGFNAQRINRNGDTSNTQEPTEEQAKSSPPAPILTYRETVESYGADWGIPEMGQDPEERYEATVTTRIFSNGEFITLPAEFRLCDSWPDQRETEQFYFGKEVFGEDPYMRYQFIENVITFDDGYQKELGTGFGRPISFTTETIKGDTYEGKLELGQDPDERYQLIGEIRHFKDNSSKALPPKYERIGWQPQKNIAGVYDGDPALGQDSEERYELFNIIRMYRDGESKPMPPEYRKLKSWPDEFATGSFRWGIPLFGEDPDIRYEIYKPIKAFEDGEYKFTANYNYGKPLKYKSEIIKGDTYEGDPALGQDPNMRYRLMGELRTFQPEGITKFLADYVEIGWKWGEKISAGSDWGKVELGQDPEERYELISKVRLFEDKEFKVLPYEYVLLGKRPEVWSTWNYSWGALNGEQYFRYEWMADVLVFDDGEVKDLGTGYYRPLEFGEFERGTGKYMKGVALLGQDPYLFYELIEYYRFFEDGEEKVYKKEYVAAVRTDDEEPEPEDCEKNPETGKCLDIKEVEEKPIRNSTRTAGERFIDGEVIKQTVTVKVFDVYKDGNQILVEEYGEDEEVGPLYDISEYSDDTIRKGHLIRTTHVDKRNNFTNEVEKSKKEEDLGPVFLGFTERTVDLINLVSEMRDKGTFDGARFFNDHLLALSDDIMEAEKKDQLSEEEKQQLVPLMELLNFTSGAFGGGGQAPPDFSPPATG